MRGDMLTGCVVLRKVAMALLFAAMCGCERQASVQSPSAAPSKEAAVPRMRDPEYTNSLKQVQDRRRGVATRRRHVAAKMEELISLARAALPAGATEEQVLHELQDNPGKYPGWRELSVKMREINAQAEKELADARSLVMTRIKKEQEETKDFKRGGSK